MLYLQALLGIVTLSLALCYFYLLLRDIFIIFARDKRREQDKRLYNYYLTTFNNLKNQEDKYAQMNLEFIATYYKRLYK